MWEEGGCKSCLRIAYNSQKSMAKQILQDFSEIVAIAVSFIAAFTHKHLKYTILVLPFVVLSAGCGMSSYSTKQFLLRKIQKLTKFRVRKFNGRYLVATKISGIRTTYSKL